MNRRVSIIVPTYKEAESLPFLVERVSGIATREQWELELLIMDDNSQDGTQEWTAGANIPWVKLVVRTADRGLSPAVLDGMNRATGDYLVCMDADLSHPPEKIPQMLRVLDDGADFVLGSRYVDGGSTDHDWGIFRWMNSQVATLMARPLTHLMDPMSGFFVIKRSQFLHGSGFNPVGYKIALELLVKCDCRKPVEIPIHFANRTRGQSKLTLQEQLKYVKHVWRLLVFKYGSWNAATRFFTIGTIGAIVNMMILSACLARGIGKQRAIVCGIAASFLGNFLLNLMLTTQVRGRSLPRRFMDFTIASVYGATMGFVITDYLSQPNGPLKSVPLAAVCGILVGAMINWMFNGYVTYKMEHYKPRLSAAEPDDT